MCDKHIFIIYMNGISCNDRLTMLINAAMVTNVLLFNDLKIIGNRSAKIVESIIRSVCNGSRVIKNINTNIYLFQALISRCFYSSTFKRLWHYKTLKKTINILLVYSKFYHSYRNHTPKRSSIPLCFRGIKFFTESTTKLFCLVRCKPLPLQSLAKFDAFNNENRYMQERYW